MSEWCISGPDTWSRQGAARRPFHRRGAKVVGVPFTRPTGNPPYSISPYSAVKRYSGKGDTTLHDAPPLRSAGRISSRAARRYHLVAVPPLDLGAMLTADRT
jgi:hypothetical protein